MQQVTLYLHYGKYIKSLTSHEAHRATTISCFLSPQPANCLHCETMDMGQVHACLLVLTAHIQGGMARLSWPGWLVTHRNGLPIRRWESIARSKY